MSKFELVSEIDLVEVRIECLSPNYLDMDTLRTRLRSFFYEGESQYDDTSVVFLCYPDLVDDVVDVLEELNAEEQENE